MAHRPPSARRISGTFSLLRSRPWLLPLAVLTLLLGVGGVLYANSTISVTVRLASADPIPEGSGSATFQVRLSDPIADGEVRVQVRTIQGAAPNSATAGADFTAVDQELVFSPGGPTVIDLPVPIIDDSADELNETFEVEITLNSETSTDDIVIGARATGLIEDNDSPNLVSITAPAAPVAEGAGSASFTVTIDAASVQPVTIRWTLSGSGANPASIPPAAGADVTVASGNWVLPVGVISRTFTIGIVDDAATEPDEQFTVDIVSVANIANSSFALAQDKQVTIDDNDTPPSLFKNLGLTVAEGGTGTISQARLEATDPEQTPGQLTYTIGTAPANGSLLNGVTPVVAGGTFTQAQINSNAITYAHNGGETTSDSFTFSVSDGVRSIGPFTFAITVTPVDDPPVAVNDTATVAEDAVATAVNVLANDTDIDGGPKTISSVTQPANGTVVLATNRLSLTYRPALNYCNSVSGTPDTFTYTLNGGSSATVSMTVTCVDDSPLANDDSVTVAEDAPATAINVLANDTDVDGGARTISAASDPARGTVVITGGGSGLTYQPDANYCSATPDTFTYTLTPGGDSATVRVTITCVDDSPVAVNDTATVAEDANATAINVLANDTDPDGGPKTISTASDPANGTVVITGGGSGLTYRPDANYCNSVSGTPDSFTYTLNPGGTTATVSVTVTCLDDPPVAVADAATVAEDAAATAVDVLANDTDSDGGPKTINSVTQPTNGTVVLAANRLSLTYRPDANYCNSVSGTPDTFTYRLAPGTSSATVSMTVTCVDDSPLANDDNVTVAEEAPATALDLLANDTDPDGGAFTIATASDPANGTVVITGGGSGLTYQPDANYCNSQSGGTPDTFTYTLNPGGDSATVRVTVTCVDDAPVAVDDSATVVEDAAATAVAVLANDTDSDGGPKTISATSDPANGTVVITGGGSGLTYRPDANYCNSVSGTPDSFTYTLNPGGTTATVSVTVTCVNDSPVVDANGGATGIDATAAFSEGGAAVNLVDPAVTISDADSTQLSSVVVQITDSPLNAADLLAVDSAVATAQGITASYSAASGSLTLTGAQPFANYQAVLATLTFANSSNNPGSSRAITITATDNGSPAASSNPATKITLTITVIDEAPTLTNNGLTLGEGATANITPAQLQAQDNDTAAGDLVFTLTATPASGTLKLGTTTLAANGTFTQADIDAGQLSYTHNGSNTASDSFSFTLTDGTTTLPAATFAITITAVNDAPLIQLTTGATAYVQGTQAVVIDAGATVSDADSTDFNGGQLRVTLSSGAALGDALSIRSQGTGAGQISVAGGIVSYGGVAIGSFTAGSSSTALVVNLNSAAATPVAVQALLRNITFASTAGGTSRTATFTLSDGDGQTSAPASKVISLNRTPTAVDDTATVTLNASATPIAVLANDSDPDGDTLTVSAVTQGTNGTVAISAGGTGLTYTPRAGFTGSDSFSYTLSDGKGGSDTATVTVSVTQVRVYLPLVFGAPLPPAQPDLQVRFAVTPASPQAGAPASVQVTVTNAGNAAASNFWVDFYINPSKAPQVNEPWNEICGLQPCYGLAWFYEGSLAPGQSLTFNSTAQSATNPNGFSGLYSNWRGFFITGTDTLYAVVDSWNRDTSGGARNPNGAVLESNETNNRAEQRITLTAGSITSGLASDAAVEIPARPPVE